MKKSTILSVIFAAVTLQLSAQNVTPLQLSGKVKDLKSGKVYLEKYENKIFKKIDSAKVVNGSFSFKTAVQLPELYGIRLEEQSYPFQVFLDQAKVSVEVDPANTRDGLKVTGSKEQDRFESLKKRQKDLTIEQLIKEDPASIVTAFAFFRNYSYSLTPQEIQSNLALLSPKLKNSQYVHILEGLVERQLATSPGQKAPDFASKGPNGETIKLSDHLGKGYVLLDFWASWCVPCRKENPNIVTAFQKYKDKGFSVFAVSLDKEKEGWIKAIKDDNLAWTQVSDLDFWDNKPAALYGVRFIPNNVLIDPNGVIVARNVKGEELQKKLAEIYANQ